jgi:hypothetical protein
MLHAIPFQLCIRINQIGPRISEMIGTEKRHINLWYILMMLIYWATCHAHLTLLELIILTMLGEEHKL